MEKTTKCEICKTMESKCWVHQGSTTLCMQCSNDILDYEIQPKYANHQALTILAQTFHERAKGKKVTFKELYQEKSSYHFIDFTSLYKFGENKTK